MAYTYIIVEDNPMALKSLQIELKKHKNFEEIGVANTMKKGTLLAINVKPQIIFLDVELGNESGFDLIKNITPYFANLPEIILTTDFVQYGKEATNLDVMYFLDKPIDPDELCLALAKFEKRNINRSERICIKNTDGHILISNENIILIVADSNCCHVIQPDTPPLLVTRTLKDIECSLSTNFIRVHKSFIVNPDFIEALNTTHRKLYIKASSIDESIIQIIKERHLVECVEAYNAKNPDKLQHKFVLPIGEIYLEKVKSRILSSELD